MIKDFPTALNDRVRDVRTSWRSENGCVGFDHAWQYPAITEQHAYRRMREESPRLSRNCVYVGFPWATLIDGLARGSAIADELVAELGNCPAIHEFRRVITVCQHIKLPEYVSWLREIGITDVFWPHKRPDQSILYGVRVHAFPLFPVVTGEPWKAKSGSGGVAETGRPLLFSFVGGYNPKHYLTRAREYIRELNDCPNAYVQIQDGWHYERAVYGEQIAGAPRTDHERESEEAREAKYASLLETSVFSLCPSGSGPNSIRLWESIESGSIPVVISEQLALPGAASLWSEACVFSRERKDDVARLPQRLEELAEDRARIAQKRQALEALRMRYGKDSFITDILTLFADKQPSNANDFRKCGPVAQRWAGDRASARCVILRLQNVGELSQIAWLMLAVSVCEEKTERRNVQVDARSLSRLVKELIRGGRISTKCKVEIVETSRLALPDGDFAFISSSIGLTTQVMELVRNLHVEPTAAPDTIDPQIYWKEVVTGRFRDRVESMVQSITGFFWRDVAHSVDALSLKPARPRVALATSVFDGDRYIEQFLSNASNLDAYHEIEHFLVRAGSPGGEHDALMKHVRCHPSAVYLNLAQDPGLYEVWNQLAAIALSPLLSSANIDDRRSPAHVDALATELEAGPEVDVASAGLRITYRPNTDWPGETGAEEWYTNSREYGDDDLWRLDSEGGVRSHNIPHCMPVWRKGLHCFYGFFNETAFGPSADWEFWLRCARGGVRLRHVGTVLGLHLKADDSYWRSTDRGGTQDRRIVDRHVTGWAPSSNVERPSIYNALSRFIGHGSVYGVLVQLMREVSALRDDPDPVDRMRYLRRFAERWFDIGSPEVLEGLRGQGGVSEQHEAVVSWLVDRLHQMYASNGAVISQVAQDNWLRMLVEVVELDRSVRSQLLLAFGYRVVRADLDAEAALLRTVEARAPKAFWWEIQRVYRLSVPLPELASATGILNVPRRDARTGRAVLGDPSEISTIYFYPDYTAGNEYQSLLYANSRNAGVLVYGVGEIESLLELQPNSDKREVIHLHWINALLDGIANDEYEKQTEKALEFIALLRQRGFLVYWTVHNKLNHESTNKHGEWWFRRRLSECVDRVFVHHPLVAHQLDWLPTSVIPSLVEHGPYDEVPASVSERQAARAYWGVGQERRLFVMVGQLRPYKGLENIWPELRAVVEADERMELLIAGKFRDERLKNLVTESTCGRIRVHDGFLSRDEIRTVMHAADAGILTYRDILTSGTLFHMMSAGVPVLGPELGTIPCYVVPGWNGFLYSDGDSLSRRVRDIVSLEDVKRSELAKNARKTTESLEWP